MRLIATFLMAILMFTQPGTANQNTKPDPCNGIHERYESTDMGPDMLVFWMSVLAATFEFCEFEELDYQVIFDRLLDEGVCDSKSYVGKKWTQASDSINQMLETGFDDFLEDLIPGSNDMSSSEVLVKKEQVCKSLKVQYVDFQECIADQDACEKGMPSTDDKSIIIRKPLPKIE